MEEYLLGKLILSLFLGGFLLSFLRFGCVLLLRALKITLKIILFARIIMYNFIFLFVDCHVSHMHDRCGLAHEALGNLAYLEMALKWIGIWNRY